MKKFVHPTWVARIDFERDAWIEIGTLMICARCKNSQYCSKNCRKKALPVHMQNCVPIAVAGVSHSGNEAQLTSLRKQVMEELAAMQENDTMRGNLVQREVRIFWAINGVYVPGFEAMAFPTLFTFAHLRGQGFFDTERRAPLRFRE
jgi:hypothetical protein